MTTTALVTGVAGQDGVLLARHLVSRGHRVVGTVRPGPPSPLTAYLDGVGVEPLDVTDTAGFARLLERVAPDEIYHLAAITAVGASWDQPELVERVNAVAVEDMLAAVLRHRDTTGTSPRFFLASSAEVFAPGATNPQDEATPHDPANPYGASKSRAQAAAVRHRDEHDLFVSVGILYNHESPLRGRSFVTRKIVRAAVEIAAGVRDEVELGNLDVSRDWGSAGDYVEAMRAATAHDVPRDYVVATGRLHTLRDLLELAFSAAGVGDPWSHVRQDPALLRQSDPPGRCGDASRARHELGWSPSTSFEDMVTAMVDVEARRVATGLEESAAYLAG